MHYKITVSRAVFMSFAVVLLVLISVPQSLVCQDNAISMGIQVLQGIENQTLSNTNLGRVA